VAALVALLVVVWVTAGSALAQPQVNVVVGTDGNLVLVGAGYRPGQKLALGVGQEVYPAFVDSAGEFEVPTGMSGSTSMPVAVHHIDTLAPAMIELAEPAPSPLAIAFAEDVLLAGAGLALLFAGLASIAFVRRAR
jgi:hypothetical protein